MDSHNAWQMFDPSLELVWLGHNDQSFSISQSEDSQKEMDDEDIFSLLSSDESSNDDHESPRGLTSYVCFTGASTKENHCPNARSPSKAAAPQRNGLNTTKLFACGVNNHYHEDSSLDLQLVSSHDTSESSTSALSRSLEKTADDLSGMFLCTSLRDQVQKRSLLERARDQRQSIFTRKSSERTNTHSQLFDYFVGKQPSLPENHGPIRREQPLDDSISSSNSSEATTDHATNVTFAKLAAMIITSQGSKKAVEPMDKTATVLELKGVGRGILSLRKLRQATTLRLLIDDYSEANFWPLLDSLYTNKSLERLELVRNCHNEPTRARTNQEMDCLFRVINRSSTLTDLLLSNFGPEDLCYLSRGLAHHASLQHLQIHFETGTLSHSFCRILATLPNLISLEAQVCHTFPISELLNSTSLSIISILCSKTAFAFAGEEMLRLAKNLEHNTTLSVLSLEPFICSNVALPAILHVLKTSNRCLETFQFSCGIATFELGDWALEQMLDTLEANSQLRVLWNNCYESWSVTAPMRQRALQVLKQHQSIEQFHVYPEPADYWYRKNNILHG